MPLPIPNYDHFLKEGTMSEYQHYIRTDANGIVIHGFTDAFEQIQPGDLLLSGQDGRHFQIQLINERGQFIYKLVNGAMVARSQEELETEWAARPTPPPSDSELLKDARLEIGRLNRSVDSLSADVQAIIDTIVI
jgi:hypothetical protein